MESSLKISRAVTHLSFSAPFYGSLLMMLKIKESTALPTMATDGTNIFWNDGFVQKCDEEETRAVLAHEALHVIFKHCQNMKGKDPQLCNVAMDWVINEILKEAGFKLPEGALFDPTGKTNGWAWEEVYKYLENIQNDKEESLDGTPGQGQPEPSNRAKQRVKDQIEGAEEHIQESQASTDSEKEEESAKIDDMIIKAASAQEASGKGDIPGEVKRKISDIREPKIDWREKLINTVRSIYPEDFSFAKPNRKHLGNDIYMPSMVGERVGKIAIGIDSSASVSEEETRAFLGEVNTIINELKPELVYLMSADYAVAKVQEHTGDVWFSMSDFEIVGGGGTSFKPVFEYVEEKDLEIDQLIYFSDMGVWDSDYPSNHPSYPVTFVGTTKATVPFGEFVYLEL